MTPNPPDADSLRGQLLLAELDLLEPAFRRVVLLLTDHGSEEGALGYVLNRPTGMTVAEVLPTVDYDDLLGIPVFVGGPVSQEHLTFASMRWNAGQNCLEYHTHLSAAEASRHLTEGLSVRAFVGYSGWSRGQLESELEQRTWVVRAPVHELLSVDLKEEDLWGKLIRDISPLHRLAADMPDDLSLN